MTQLRVHMKARPERVFAAWTDPALLVQWWGPQAEAEVDLRIGGQYRLSMRYGDVLLIAVGEYREITPPELLVFTWRWEGEKEETLVTLHLREVVGGTELILDHDGFADASVAEDHRQGWSDCIARLQGLSPAIDQ